MRIDGGIRTGAMSPSEVKVEKNLYVEHFGAQTFVVRLASMKIGGDLVFAANGLPPGAPWDGMGLSPVLKEPSRFGARLGNVTVSGYLVFRGW